MNVQKVYVAVYVTIDLADGDTVYEPITDVSFDSEVSDKDFICQQAVSRPSTTCATLAALAARLTRTTASSRITRGR